MCDVTLRECDMFHSCVRLNLVTWMEHVTCDVFHSCVRTSHVYTRLKLVTCSIHVTWLNRTHEWNMSHSRRVTSHIWMYHVTLTYEYMWRGSIVCRRDVFTCGWHDSSIHVWRDSFIMCDMPHWYVWYDAVMCAWRESIVFVTWLIHSDDMVHSGMCVTWPSRVWTWRIRVRVTWLIHTCWTWLVYYVWYYSLICDMMHSGERDVTQS